MATTSDPSATSRWSRSIWTALALGLFGAAASIAFALPANAATASIGGGTEISAPQGGIVRPDAVSSTPDGTRIGGFGVSSYGSARDRSGAVLQDTVDSYMSGRPDVYIASS
jgi:hypothetical protein